MEDVQKYLKPTYFFDYENEVVQRFVKKWVKDEMTPKEKAIAIYHGVRDGWFYNAYKIYITKDKWRVSDMMQRETGHCIDKAAMMITCCRAAGVPARLFLAKIKNHIGVERLIEALGTDELSPHGSVEVYLDGKWVKATPAFNQSLCDKLGVATLEFNGEEDSLFQEYDKSGGVFMEYLEEYGHFEDLPIGFMFENMRQTYPKVAEMYRKIEHPKELFEYM